MLTAHATATSSDAGLRATPDKSPPFGSLTTRRLQTARRAARCPIRPRRPPATPMSRQTSGGCHSHRQTVFGRTAPNLSTTDGPQSDAATAPIAAASGKFGVPSPTRRTSPVMTNKRIKSVLEPARNAAIMAPPSADPYPAGCPATLPQSLPLHPDPLFGPGAFLPLT